VRIQEVTRELAESFGLSKPAGALIAKVEKGGPAEKAGVLTSDIIIKFDGKAVESSNELPRLVGQTKVGKAVKIEVWRKGAVKQLTLSLGEFPEESRQAAKPGEKPAAKPAGKLGLSLAELSETQKEQLNVTGGVLVEEAGGLAAKAGIRRGDVILAINNQDVATPDQFNELIAQFESRKSVAVLVRRGENALYLPLKLAEK
jgi:serine protease Do